MGRKKKDVRCELLDDGLRKGKEGRPLTDDRDG